MGDEPEIRSWGEAKKGRGGAVDYDSLMDDLNLDDDAGASPAAPPAPTPAQQAPAQDQDARDAELDALIEAELAQVMRREGEGQPAWARPPVASLDEDLWPDDLPGEGGTADEAPGEAPEAAGEDATGDAPAFEVRRPAPARVLEDEDVEVRTGPGGPAPVPDDLWDAPEVRHDRAPPPAWRGDDGGSVEVRQQTASGSRRLQELDAEE